MHRQFTSRPQYEPCNVCHTPVNIRAKRVVYMRPRCLDCAWQSNSIYVFCSEACAHRWNPPALPSHPHAEVN
jgi:hypothetical protein